MTLARRTLLLLALALPALPGRAVAQKLTLLITGGAPIAFPTVTETDYDAGSVTATTALGYSLDLLGGGGGGVNRTGSISIRATTTTMGGTKPIADLQWRRSDLATWNSMTTTNAVVESRTMRRNTLNDPYTGSIVFRVLLSWDNDGPATYTPTIVVTATLTTP